MRPFVNVLFIFLLFFSGCSSNNKKETEVNQEVFIGITDDPQALDPRLIRDTISVNVAHMLFEGLMQKNRNGRIIPGLATGVDISEDKKTYTFHLRNAFWSDGSDITAEDFEYSWKSVLNPTFPAPNAYQLYVIKGAKAAKNNELPISEIGIKAIDNKTLEVTLEEPTPYFLELTTTHFFSPVNKKWAEKNSNLYSNAIISNGPFQITNWSHNKELIFKKNPYYWDSKSVRLEKVTLVIADETTALHMFNRNELDWIGSPMSNIPPDAIATLKSQRKLIFTPADGVHFLRVNTDKSPLNNKNMRKALSYAINRKLIVDHITQSNQKPATGIVPLSFGLQNIPYFEDNNITLAWTLFQQALIELDLSIDEFPNISLCYTSTERNHKIVQALQQQWKEGLGIDITLEACEPAIFYDRLHQKNYDLTIGSWFGDIHDPINFLEVFKYKESATNNTNWENKEYISLLEQSMHQVDSEQRKFFLSKAEHLIIDEMPVIPIYYPTFHHLQKKINGGLKDVYFSELGYIDLKNAYKG